MSGMFTSLFDQFVRSVDTMPILVVYAIIAAWVGAESLGIPVPLELMLLFAGSLVGLGRLSIVLALFTVLLASLICAAIAYFVGRRAGAHALTRIGRHVGLTQERITSLDAWLRLRGTAGVICARVIPGIRLFSSYVMGIAAIPPLTFVVGIAVGTLGYSTIWMLVGILLGNNYRAPLHYLDALGIYGPVLAAAAIIAGLAAHHVLGRHTLNRLAIRHHPQPTALATAQRDSLAGALQEPAQGGKGLRDVAVPISYRSQTPRSFSTPSRRFFKAANTFDRRLADAVGLRGPGLLAQVRAPWPSGVITALVTLWAALAIVLVFLSVAAHRYAVFPLDVRLTSVIQQLRGTVFAALIYPAGDLQWYLPSTIAYVIIFATLLVLRLYSAALFVALSSFGADLVHLILNIIVARPRPHGVAIPAFTAVNLGSASYPSGHVAHVVGLYGFLFFLCVLAMRARPQLTPWLLVIQAICVYFLVFVGISRILEGQHWPSDVVAGYLVGVVVVTLVIALYHRAALRHFTKYPGRWQARGRTTTPTTAPQNRALAPQDQPWLRLNDRCVSKKGSVPS